MLYPALGRRYASGVAMWVAQRDCLLKDTKDDQTLDTGELQKVLALWRLLRDVLVEHAPLPSADTKSKDMDDPAPLSASTPQIADALLTRVLHRLVVRPWVEQAAGEHSELVHCVMSVSLRLLEWASLSTPDLRTCGLAVLGRSFGKLCRRAHLAAMTVATVQYLLPAPQKPLSGHAPVWVTPQCSEVAQRLLSTLIQPRREVDSTGLTTSSTEHWVSSMWALLCVELRKYMRAGTSGEDWKNCFPSASPLVHWFVLHVRAPAFNDTAGAVWPLLLPMINDYEVPNKVRGVQAALHFERNTNPSEFALGAPLLEKVRGWVESVGRLPPYCLSFCCCCYCCWRFAAAWFKYVHRHPPGLTV